MKFDFGWGSAALRYPPIFGIITPSIILSPREAREVAMRFRRSLAFLTLATGLVFALSAWAQQKPFTQEQVSNMVRAGLGDESGAKLIEQRGIDFAPSEDFLQNLKATGASEAFLKALRAAKPPEPASAHEAAPPSSNPRLAGR